MASDESRASEPDPAAAGPAVGARFPDVVPPDQTGRTVDLHAYRDGRPALFVVQRSAAW